MTETDTQETPPVFYADNGEQQQVVIPSSQGILPLRNIVLFPGMVVPLTIGRDRSIKLVESVMLQERMLGVLAQKDPNHDNPGSSDLYPVGTVCRILKLMRMPEGQETIIVQGLARFRVTRWVQESPFLRADIEHLVVKFEKTREVEALTLNVKRVAARMVELSPNIPPEIGAFIQGIEDPSLLLDLIAGSLNTEIVKKQEILETLDVLERFHKVNIILNRQVEVLELGDKIHNQVKDAIDKNQKEFYLRQQLHAIREELGEGDEQEAETNELRKKIAEAKMPPEVELEANRELERLASMPTAAAEHSVIRTYLGWLIDLPWSKTTTDQLDLDRASDILENDHYGLEKVKKRIVEYLAVRKLKSDTKGPILCFVGPPGVGKTSLGQSIAKALGRTFIRISLGGVRDEAEIRGHRRTYVGALPGRIIQSIRKAGTNNPVFMLDEVDKVGTDFRGDPSSALLEVLDPEQNGTFSDHYLDVPFDLSKVMFITTANLLEPIPAALRDRMEVMELPGYTAEEKEAIALKYLIPRQTFEHGLKKTNLKLTVYALRKIIHSYTREAGVRNLEREIATICRGVASSVARGEKKKVNLTPKDLKQYLGPERFQEEIAERTSQPGVATGLAKTNAGGEIIFVEATKMPGSGNMLLTGQLGEVMKESAQAALSYLRSKAEDYGIDKDIFAKTDLHVHVPAGGVPKDGPSAGVSLFTALTSLFTDRPARSDTAMTGEITLRGLVLPVGGIKEKILAARRAGIKTVLLPERNRKDLEEIPEQYIKGMRFEFLTRVEQLLDLALRKDPDKNRVKVTKAKPHRPNSVVYARPV